MGALALAGERCGWAAAGDVAALGRTADGPGSPATVGVPPFGLSEAVVKAVAGGSDGPNAATSFGADGVVDASMVGPDAATDSVAIDASAAVGGFMGVPTLAGGFASGSPRPSLRPAASDLERTVRPGAASGERWAAADPVGVAVAVEVALGAACGRLSPGSRAVAAGDSLGSAAGAGVLGVAGTRSSSIRPLAALSLMADR